MPGCARPSRIWPGPLAEEFLEHTKLELFHDQVFCFTPKGRLIALPRKATPIDFAYAVHTDIGNTAVGCKINGTIAPLVSELKNGDEVEIITSKAQTPPGHGDHRRHRQGARRRASCHPRGCAGAICRPRPQDRRARLRPRRKAFSEEAVAKGMPRLARTAWKMCSPPWAAAR